MSVSPETPSSGKPRSGGELAGDTHAGSGTDTDVLAISSSAADETERIIEQSTPDSETFGADIVHKAKRIVTRYPYSRSALLPMLHLVQSVQGHVSQEGIAFCAEQLDLTAAEVSAVVTFYTMYKRRPCGEHLVSVCTNTLCAALGGDAIYRKLGEHLGDGEPLGREQTAGVPGQTGSVTLEHVECLAACDLAPVLQVNYEYYDKQTPESAVEVVDQLRRGEKPPPTRGAPLSDFRSIELALAGFFPEDAEQYNSDVDGPSATQETLRGARLAQERGWSAPAMNENVSLPEVEKK